MRVAGFGFSSRATSESLRDAMERACAAAHVDTVQVLSTAQDKTALLAALAQALSLPFHAVSEDQLKSQDTQTQSSRVVAERGTGSVAEAAALSAAGQGSRLLTKRVHAQDRLASCAIAEGFPE